MIIITKEIYGGMGRHDFSIERNIILHDGKADIAPENVIDVVARNIKEEYFWLDLDKIKDAIENHEDYTKTVSEEGDAILTVSVNGFEVKQEYNSRGFGGYEYTTVYLVEKFEEDVFSDKRPQFVICENFSNSCSDGPIISRFYTEPYNTYEEATEALKTYKPFAKTSPGQKVSFNIGVYKSGDTSSWVYKNKLAMEIAKEIPEKYRYFHLDAKADYDAMILVKHILTLPKTYEITYSCFSGQKVIVVTASSEETALEIAKASEWYKSLGDNIHDQNFIIDEVRNNSIICQYDDFH